LHLTSPPSVFALVIAEKKLVRVKAIPWDAVVLTFNCFKQANPMTFDRQDRLKLQLDYAKYLTSTSIFTKLECEVTSCNQFM